MEYVSITENDVSIWKDQTGEVYHFPKRYRNLLKPGTQVVYYKGRLQDARFLRNRLSRVPHYFGVAEIGNVFTDPESSKRDLYAEIVNFRPFFKSVPFKVNNKPLEPIPANLASNYWRNGVRPITKAVFDRIIELAGITELSETFNDSELVSTGYESEIMEGGQNQKYTTYYERNPVLRQQAIEIHGYNCQVCQMNFAEAYGEWGEGFIHVHHKNPISKSVGKIAVNPRTDMAVLCANCHSMVHRRKDRVLSVEDLVMKMKKKEG